MEMKTVAYFISCVWLVILLHSFFAHGLTNITTDEDALLALKVHVIDDPSNALTTNWSKAASVCNWAGITCGARHGRVTALNLSHMNLAGTIPPHLGNMSFLAFISFHNNSFHGSLPNELAKLRRMKSFIFNFNYFSGQIPSWVGSFTRLERLGLAFNMFTGSIPPSLFNLSKLNAFGLSSNRLHGYIPEAIGNLRSLRLFYLENNQLYGSIPSGIFNISSLQQIDLSNNWLSGPMPNICTNMSSLRIMDLGVNDLRGVLPPTTFTYFPNLEVISLSWNQFVGPIPSGLSACRQLNKLSLSINHFQGSIDKDIWNLTMLQHLYLGYNNFSGTEIPISIGNLLNLETLSFPRTGLVGAIPSSISNLTRLKILDLSDNSLTGTIPYEMGKLANVEQINLGMNMLFGFVPFGIYNVSSMTTISLPDNHLSGSLPPSLGLQLLNLEKLLLGENNFTGSLPKSLSNASKLVDVSLVLNSFFGPIPDELGNLRNLKTIDLAQNLLTLKSLSSGLSIFSSLAKCKDLRLLSLGGNLLNGSLPNSLGNLSLTLKELVVDACGIIGTIPKEIGNLSNLIKLVLRENNLKGTIPTSITNLTKLQGLYLEKNKLEGSLPIELCNLQRLGYLYLGVNELFGPIPSCLGNVSSLRILSLGINNFSSTIPSTLWRLKDIIQLDLPSNSLSGSLSMDIGNLKVATLIDLSGNHLSGNIPPTFDGLKDLSYLSLANNKLEGFIPSAFGDAISLQLLDLSNNSLSGVIPKSFVKLLHLTNFNVSFNKLEGEIPNEAPFVNFSAKSFLGNEGLCGEAKFEVQPCKINSIHRKLVLKKALLAIGFTVLALVVTFIIFIIMVYKRNLRLARTEQRQPSPLVKLKRISYLDIEHATNKFNEINLLGKGSFGSVYKGILSDGMIVAIKVFNLQVEGAFKSFDVESEVLRMIRHRNLVKIITSCCSIDFKALVLGFMPNHSLENWLYSHNLFLDILERLNIMIDVASALDYLYHGCTTPIVHCDLKPNNILLDGDMVAHVSDFGIAKLLGQEQLVIQTITLATVGYMAPEYGSEGVVSIEGDMYSYGILLMETFTKKKPTDEMFNDEMNMKQWVKESLPGRLTQIIDTNLLRIEDDQFSAKHNCISSIMQLALQCSADLPKERLGIKDALNTLNKVQLKFIKDISYEK